MAKHHTIVLHAIEEQVPLKLTARQQALVDAVVNRAPSTGHATVSPATKPQPTARGGRKPR